MSIKGLIAVTSGLAGVLLAGVAQAASKYNMPPGVTEISREVYGLHMLIFWICVAIAVVVFGAMFYSIINHRLSKGAKPADFHESTTVEIIWTVIPFIILISMAIPAAGTLLKMEDSSNPDMTIKVTGYQWKWEYEYLDHDVSFFSSLAATSNEARQLDSGIDPNTVDNYLLEVDNEVVVPVGKKVRILLTAADVLHAWWVPELAVKKDAIPGYINEMWFKIDEDKTGTYRGQCAELCGRDHGFMPVVVRAVTQSEFDQWVAEQGGKSGVDVADSGMTASDAAPVVAVKASPPPAESGDMDMATAMEKGKQGYMTHCVACHQAGGEGMPPAGFPALAGSPVATSGSIKAHIEMIVRGKGAMPPFGGMLSDADIAAITTYERNAWGNDTGDLVKASDVSATR